MKKTLLIAIAVILFSNTSASAQFLGQLTPAPTVNKGEALLGAYLGVYQRALCLLGQFRYGVLRYVDLGLKMGMIDYDPGDGKSDAGLTVSADIKYWFMEQRTGDVLDVSVGGGTEHLKIPDHSIFSLGGNVVASYQIQYDQAKSVTPYGRLNLRWERETSSRSFGGSENQKRRTQSDMGAALALGAELKLWPDLSLVGELQIDDNVGFIAGVNYSVF